MNKKSFGFFILVAFVLFGCRSTQVTDQDDWKPIASTLTIIDDLEAQHRVMLAFAQGYPDRINNVQFINDDWTMLVNGKRFYFANGRFLPEELRSQWERYHPYDFYTYPWAGTEAQRLAFQKNPVYASGSSYLFETIYASPTEDASWDLQEKYSFFGVKMLVHAYIKPKLDIVAREVRLASQTDNSINEWIAELHTGVPSFGWTWRQIAGTSRRSNHSYGTAIDLLPRELRGRLTYWRWNQSGSTGNTYYMPPEAVIRIFEDHGFIWGGHWALIDTMHFEYRPEILLLNGYTIK